MSFKKIALAALLSASFMTSAAFAEASKPAVEKFPHLKDTITHLMDFRHALVADMKEADSEEKVLEAAKNIAHIDDAIATLHAVGHVHDNAHKLDK
tara:strand:+ start:995 stop:1282 length:288 start_codon:yes stop_codon:yes gene_type:complete